MIEQPTVTLTKKEANFTKILLLSDPKELEPELAVVQKIMAKMIMELNIEEDEDVEEN